MHSMLPEGKNLKRSFWRQTLNVTNHRDQFHMELPCISCVGICGPNGYGFLAVLAITKASILGIFLIVRVRVWFLNSCPELDMPF